MADKNMGFIKIDRNMLNWRWWKNHNTFHVFLTILLHANYKDGDFEKTTIHRGQWATSYGTISSITGLTISQIRTAISNLISTGEIAITRKPRYIVITVINYSRYQDVSSQIADKSHADRTQIAGKSQQSKKERKKEGKNIPPKPPSGGQSPSGSPERGTELWKAKAHVLLDRDSGTVDDIPDDYRAVFKTWQEYYDWRNQ